MKTCKRCLEQKEITEFYRHHAMADGHLSFCKPCVRRYALEHRRRNLERVQRYDRLRGRGEKRKAAVAERAKRNREYSRAKCRESAQRYPDKLRARALVGNAVRDGRLKRCACERCGDERVQAHHDDYTKPLDVRWLCSKHHGEEHRRHED